MSKVVNGYTLNEDGESAPWGAREETLLTAFAGLLPPSGDTICTTEHLHAKLVSPDKSLDVVETDNNGYVSVANHTNSADVELHASHETATTDAVVEVLRASLQSSGEGAVGFGARLGFEIRSGVGSQVLAVVTGAIDSVMTNVGDGTKTASMKFSVAENNSLVNVLTLTPDDLYTTAWTNYTATSTIVGWSSYAGTTYIVYKKIGKMVFVMFQINGTGDETTTTFTLPHAAKTTAPVIYAMVKASDSGVAGNETATISINAASDVVTFNRLANLSWSAGSKFVGGEFFYETD